MSVYFVEVAAAAEGDIQDAFLWYRERSMIAAEAFRTETIEAIEQIGKTPLGRSPDEAGNRRRVLHRFPYSVVYEVAGSTVTILAVTHHRRKPGYWKT